MPKAILEDGRAVHVGAAEFETLTCLIFMGWSAPTVLSISRKSFDLGLDIEDARAHAVVKSLERKGLITTVKGKHGRAVALTTLGVQVQFKIGDTWLRALTRTKELLIEARKQQRKGKE